MEEDEAEEGEGIHIFVSGQKILWQIKWCMDSMFWESRWFERFGKIIIHKVNERRKKRFSLS